MEENSTLNEIPIESVPAVPKPPFGFWKTILWGFVVMICYLAASVSITIVYLVWKAVLESTDDIYGMMLSMADDGLYLSLVIIVSGIIGTGIVLLILKLKRDVRLWEYLGFRKISIKTVFLSLGITVGLLVLFAMIGNWFGSGDSGGWVETVYESTALPPVLWAAMVLIAPLFEEIFFRGFLFRGFRESPLKTGGAIVLTSGIWMLMHTQYSIDGWITIFFIGIVFGLARHRTGSIWASLIMHAFYNLIVVFQVSLLG